MQRNDSCYLIERLPLVYLNIKIKYSWIPLYIVINEVSQILESLEFKNYLLLGEYKVNILATLRFMSYGMIQLTLKYFSLIGWTAGGNSRLHMNTLLL